MMELKYSEILRLNKEISTNLKSKLSCISILSNITIHQIKEILDNSPNTFCVVVDFNIAMVICSVLIVIRVFPLFF